MKPSDYYQQQVSARTLKHDVRQLDVIQQLDTLSSHVIAEYRARQHLLLKWWRRPQPIPGLYLWGSVGVGKTLLMDCFYQSLPFKQKKRQHFHQFMQDLHQRLKIFHSLKDPMSHLATELASETMVLCFDEFFVRDIADAMLLAGIMQGLLQQGVCLIATSNVPPEKLYENGLQRQNFLPTIRLLQQQTEVVAINTGKDYRRTFFQDAGVYYSPLNEQASHNMQKAFALHQTGFISTTPIKLLDREVSTIQHSQSVIWFDFISICGHPRCQADYLALIETYSVVLVSGVREILSHESDLIVNFIHLIDILYDAHVQLIISATVPAEQLYDNGRLQFSFQRTRSRLYEMQSQQYMDERKDQR